MIAKVLNMVNFWYISFGLSVHFSLSDCTTNQTLVYTHRDIHAHTHYFLSKTDNNNKQHLLHTYMSETALNAL